MPGHTGYYSDLSEFVNTDQILDQTELYRDQALAAAGAALAAEVAAETAQTSAETAAMEASTSANAAADSVTAATDAATSAAESAVDAQGSENDAETAASAAASSATAAALSAGSAAASAAGVNLPSAAGQALNYLRQNAGTTGFEYRTPTQTRSDLSLGTSALVDASQTNTASTVVQRGAAGEIVGGAVTATTIGGTTITASVGLVGPGSGVTALNMANAGSGTLAVARGGTGVTTGTGTGSNVLSASPALTGTPTAPTATLGTNTTQVATTGFVSEATVPIQTQLTSVAGRVTTLESLPVRISQELNGMTGWTPSTQPPANCRRIILDIKGVSASAAFVLGIDTSTSSSQEVKGTVHSFSSTGVSGAQQSTSTVVLQNGTDTAATIFDGRVVLERVADGATSTAASQDDWIYHSVLASQTTVATRIAQGRIYRTGVPDRPIAFRFYPSAGTFDSGFAYITYE